MSQPATTAQQVPRHAECNASVLASQAGATVFAIVMAGLETWLRMPVQPVLDGYLQAVFSHAASIDAALFRKHSF